MFTATVRDAEGKAVGIIVLAPKTFKSGAGGFFGQGKIIIDGVRYQAQAQLVAIAERPEKVEFNQV